MAAPRRQAGAAPKVTAPRPKAPAAVVNKRMSMSPAPQRLINQRAKLAQSAATPRPKPVTPKRAVKGAGGQGRMQS